MDFLNLAKKRCSIRKYEKRGVEDSKLKLILEAGRIAPTAANMQPQRIIVVQSEEGLKKLGKGANIYGAPLALVVCADKSEGWVRPADGFNACEVDASIVTDHMMLEATSLGLGSVWICYFSPEIIRKEFNLPQDIVPINILAIGYAAETFAPADRHNKMRKPLSQTIFYESF